MEANHFTGLIFLLITLGVLAAVAYWALRPVTTYDIAEWSGRRGVEMEGSDAELVKRYLGRSRAWRRRGFAIPFAIFFFTGFVMTSAESFLRPDVQPRLYLPEQLSWVASPFSWSVAYLVGVLAAEVTWSRQRPSSVHRAAVSVRHVRQYVPAWVTWAVRTIPVLALATVVALAVLPVRPQFEGERELTRAMVLTVLVTGLAVLLELTMRWVVSRPQPVTSVHGAVVDDAIRSTAVHHIAGPGIAMLCWLLSDRVDHVSTLVGTRFIDDGMSAIYVTNTLGVIRAVLILGGVGAWLWLSGSSRWTVKRPLRSAPVVP